MSDVDSDAQCKRARVSPSWLNLASFGLYRDLRKLIYKRLDWVDRVVVEAAHFGSRPVRLGEMFASDALCAGTSRCCSGQWRGAAPWTARRRARARQREDTWQC